MQDSRPAAVAGAFYPASPALLASLVDELLAGASPAVQALPKALIVPHAGYIYSGPIAASAYALLRPWAARIERVVVVGPAHRVWLDGVASPGARRLDTPLGALEVDLSALARVPVVGEDARAHAREHSVEVQLPFVQRLAPHARVVPLVVGGAGPAEVGRVLEALWGGPETLVLVSSDLSHYLSYVDARARDAETAARILALEPVAGDEACGAAGINGLLWVARKKGLEPVLLDLRSSGDTAGDHDEVVGYGAFAFFDRAAVGGAS